MMRFNKNRKGQEEIVGFVLIVVIVAVVFLILLGLFLRGDRSDLRKESKDVYQFLESSMEYTTECAKYEPNYLSLGSVLRECYSNARCINGKSACQVLNETFKGIIDSSFQVGEERPIKGYIFNANFNDNVTSQEIVRIERGSCSNSSRGNEYISPAGSGTIISSLDLCY